MTPTQSINRRVKPITAEDIAAAQAILLACTNLAAFARKTGINVGTLESARAGATMRPATVRMILRFRDFAPTKN